MSSPTANFSSEHISAVEAARQFGFTNDYITRLAREKKVAAKRMGRQWYVDAGSVQSFIDKSEEVKKAYAENLRAERKRERSELSLKAQNPVKVSAVPLQSSRASALAKSGMVLCASIVVGGLIFSAAQQVDAQSLQTANVFASLKEFALRLYGLGESETQVSPEDFESAGASAKVHGAAMTTQISERSATSSVPADSLMVIPPSDTRSAESIEKSFSDEVRVARDADGKSGVITPVFKNATSTQYRYLMVPLKAVAGSP